MPCALCSTRVLMLISRPPCPNYVIPPWPVPSTALAAWKGTVLMERSVVRTSTWLAEVMRGRTISLKPAGGPMFL